MGESTFDKLQRVPALADLNDKTLAALSERVTEIAMDDGEMLFKEGEPGESLAFVIDGTLEAHQLPFLGGEVTVGRIYPGEIVGEMACIDPGPRSATVAAKGPSNVMVLSRSALLDLEREHPALGVTVSREVIRELSVRLRDANYRIDAELARRGMTAQTRPPERSGGGPVGGSESERRLDLRQVSCLQSFNNGELQALAAFAPPRTYPVGHVLCDEGAEADGSWILARGSVTAYRRLGTENRYLATLGAGSILGHMALIDDSPRSARLVVESKAILLPIAADAMRALIDEQTPFAMKLQREICVSGVRALRHTTRNLGLMLGTDPARYTAPVTRERARPARPTAPQITRATSAEPAAQLTYIRAAAGEWALSSEGFGSLDG